MDVINVIANNIVYGIVNFYIILRNTLYRWAKAFLKFIGFDKLSGRELELVIIIALIVIVAVVLTIIIFILRRRNNVTIDIEINEQAVDKVRINVTQDIKKNIQRIQEESIYDFERFLEYIDIETLDVDKKKYSVIITHLDEAITNYSKTYENE